MPRAVPEIRATLPARRALTARLIGVSVSEPRFAIQDSTDCASDPSGEVGV
jgi:hypothetical protein